LSSPISPNPNLAAFEVTLTKDRRKQWEKARMQSRMTARRYGKRTPRRNAVSDGVEPSRTFPQKERI
jgi:hypothetical protein